MSEINIKIDADSLVSDVVNLIDMADLANDVFNHIDLDDIAEKAADRIDLDDLASEVVDNINMRDFADRVADYIDISSLASEVEDNIDVSNLGALSTDDLEKLARDYDPSTSCPLGYEVTKLMVRGFNYIIQRDMDDLEIDGIGMEDTRLLKTLVKCVEEYVKPNVANSIEAQPTLQVDENLITVAQPQIDEKFSVTLSFEELRRFVLHFVLTSDAFLASSDRDGWNKFFNEMLPLVLTAQGIDYSEIKLQEEMER